jgi:hypothetical protein
MERWPENGNRRELRPIQHGLNAGQVVAAIVLFNATIFRIIDPDSVLSPLIRIVRTQSFKAVNEFGTFGDIDRTTA